MLHVFGRQRLRDLRLRDPGLGSIFSPQQRCPAHGSIGLDSGGVDAFAGEDVTGGPAHDTQVPGIVVADDRPGHPLALTQVPGIVVADDRPGHPVADAREVSLFSRSPQGAPTAVPWTVERVLRFGALRCAFGRGSALLVLPWFGVRPVSSPSERGSCRTQGHQDELSTIFNQDVSGGLWTSQISSSRSGFPSCSRRP